MKFLSPTAEAVYERYNARLASEWRRLTELGPASVAVRDQFLLPIGPDSGRLLHALILARKPRRILELGTSYGYSTLFLADAAQQVGAAVVTVDCAKHKQDYAREQLQEAGLAGPVEFRCGDAIELIEADKGWWDFILLDIWKELYCPSFEAFYPKLSEEAVIAADNMIEPAHNRGEVRQYRDAVRQKMDLQTILLPIGSGIELTLKWTPGNAKL